MKVSSSPDGSKLPWLPTGRHVARTAGDDFLKKENVLLLKKKTNLVYEEIGFLKYCAIIDYNKASIASV